MACDLSKALNQAALPPPFDPDHAERTLETVTKEIGADQLSGLECQALASLAGNSPYLARLIQREALWLPNLFRDDDPLAAILTTLGELGDTSPSTLVTEAELMAGLRQAKRRAALLIALYDVAGLWPVMETTRALSALADQAVAAAISWLTADAVGKGRLPERALETPAMMVLAMGKLGAGELNYSSDIDLVLFFDPDVLPDTPAHELQSAYVRMAKSLVRILGEMTGDGYVFRTDLRLRPDAGATAPVISTVAAEHYYESLGQNWERAAYIKARALNPGREVGDVFLDRLQPFIWRKNLDFNAIEDIQSIKRQIRSHHGGGAIQIAGHNVKLGRGGIREIEFFVQTQQLIAGGRDPSLRSRGTLEGLDALAKAGWITPDAASRLTDCYLTLRQIEHRIQMIHDEQTHIVPQSDEGLARLACFLGHDSVEAFSDQLRGVLEQVRTYSDSLFEREESLADETGSLVFTGTEDDPDTLETLSNLGFTRPPAISAAIRHWHHGRIPATRSPRAREVLTRMIPLLVHRLSAAPDPDQAFIRFDRFLHGVPAGVQLFSLLKENPKLLELVIETLGLAPRLGEYLAQNRAVLDAVLDQDFFGPLKGRPALQGELGSQVADVCSGEDCDFEAMLDTVRRFVRDEKFRIGVQVLRGLPEPEEAGAAFSSLAEAAVNELCMRVTDDHVQRHGRVAGGNFAVIAFGKLGGREMTAASDLDLIFIYDDEAGDLSNGARPLSLTQYYARLGQKLVNALTAPTTEGELYEVDMRLRPSGRAGPLATQLKSFRAYQAESAWTWEKLALTRARVIAASPPFRKKVTQAIRESLVARRHPETAAGDVKKMRELIARERKPAGPWDIKLSPGGVVDVEFICQYLQLIHGAARPEVLSQNSRDALFRLEKSEILSHEDARILLEAHDLYSRLGQLFAVALEDVYDPVNTPQPLLQAVLKACGAENEAAAEALREATMTDVRVIFERLIA